MRASLFPSLLFSLPYRAGNVPKLTLRAKMPICGRGGWMMSVWVRGGVLAGADDLVAELGGDFAALSNRAGLRADVLDHPDMPVDAATIPLFLEIAAKQLDCPTFGLRLGQLQDLDLFGSLGVPIRNAPTVRDLIYNLVFLFPLHTQGAIAGLTEEGDDIILTYELSTDVYPSHRHVVELGFSILLGEIGRHCPGWQSSYVAFRHAPLSDTFWHRRLLGPNLLFNADRNALLLDAALLTRPRAPAHGNPGRTLPVERAHLRRADLIPFHTERLVRASLPSRLLGVAEVARLLGISKRSLQRRLTSAGSSFGAIADAVRSDLALAYLRDSRLTVAQIAETLHFSETSALSRAVRRWHGRSPRDLRQNQDYTRPIRSNFEQGGHPSGEQPSPRNDNAKRPWTFGD